MRALKNFVARKRWRVRWEVARLRSRGKSGEPRPSTPETRLLWERKRADDEEESRAHRAWLHERGLTIGWAESHKTSLAIRACKRARPDLTGPEVVELIEAERAQFSGPDDVYMAAVTVWKRERVRAR